MALFPPLAYTEYALPLLLPLSKVSLQLSNSPACLFPIPSFTVNTSQSVGKGTLLDSRLIFQDY